MSPNKVKVNVKGKWTEENMKLALNYALTGKTSVREAARLFSVPKSSLQDRISKLKKGEEVVLPAKLGRFKSTFLQSCEEELLQHVRQLDNMFMPLTRKEFLKLAFDLAEQLKLPHRFNKNKQIAGKDFYYAFVKRHPEVALRTPESTSVMRAVGFNKPQVDLFFSKLNQLMEKHSFPSSRIFNADETGVSSVHENSKVLSIKGKRQVGKLTSGERGRNITLTFCMSASGQFIAPLFIFPRQKMNPRLMIGAPDESQGVAQPNGWMNGDIFETWLKHFVKHVRPSKDSPVLLILDGHCSHKELKVILYARKHHVHMLSTPPHTTHKLQPLDRSFMKPFKSAYSEACASWMRQNPGLKITEYDIAQIVCSAYGKVCRMEIAQKGFSCTGIHPFNPSIFSDLDFMPSRITEVEIGAVNGVKTNSDDPIAAASVTIAEKSDSSVSVSPGSSGSANIASALKKLSPLPDASKRRLATRKRRAEKSEILTATPYKERLEEKKNEKEAHEKRKHRKCSKMLNLDEPSTSAHVPMGLNEASSSTETFCILCGESFEEDWIQCEECKGWAHENCTNMENAAVHYTCDKCLQM